MSSLAEQNEALIKGGFSQKEISNWKQEKIFSLEQGGYEQEEILKEFGYQPIERGPIKKIWNNIITLGKEEKKSTYEKLLEVEKNEPDNISLKEKLVGETFEVEKYWDRGFNMGIVDLVQNYHQLPGNSGTGLPEGYVAEPFEDTGIIERNIQNLAVITKDLPVYLTGALLTNLLTWGRAGKVGTAAGTGFFAGSIRETYLNMLESGQVHSWSEFWDIYTKEGVKAGGKEAIQLGAAVGLGGYGKNFISKLLLRVAGFEGSGAIIEQELPSKDQLIDSTILFGAFGLAEAGGAKVVNTIKRTNNNAIDIATDYIADKTVVEDLSSKNIDIPRAYKKPETKVVKEDAFKKDIKLDTEAENTILNKIRYAKEEITEPGKANKLTQGFIDRLHPVYRMVKEVDKTKNRTGKLSVYERFRTLVGMEHRAGHFIEVGTLDKNLKQNGKSFKEILKPIGKDKKSYLEFGAYKVAKRIIELEKRGIKHTLDLKAAQEVVANKELVKKYEKISKEYDGYNLRVLTYAKDKGLITEDAFKAMVEANKNYVPFSRVMDSAAGEVGYTKNVSNPLKKIKDGKGLDIIDPIETTYSNTFHIIKLAERNAALIEFFDFVAKNQKSFPDIQKSARTRQIKIERKELEQILDDTSANFISDKAVENFKVFRKEYLEPTETQVGVIRNGKFETYEVGKELAQALKDFDPKSLGDITKMFRLNAPARWLRAGATASPDFVFPNIFRDTVTAAVFSKYGFVPLWSSLEGAVTLALGKSGLSRNSKEIYNKWLRSGGMQSTLVSIDRNIFDKPAFEILNRGPIRNSLKTPLEYLRLISEFSENMTRISEFKRAYTKSRRNAMTEKEAIERGGFESRDITIDYAKMGLYMKGLNQVAAFYNARVQGYTKIYEAFRDRPGRAMTMITASIILPSIYFWFANKDNEVYQRQEEWVKTNYWIIVKDGVPYRISKPFDLGIVFGTGTEQLLDWLNKEHPDELSDFLYDFGISTLKSFNPTPTFGVPILESLFDKSFFTGKPLVPDYMDKKLLSKYQYTTYTSEVAKSISRAMNILVGDHTKLDSPIVIDNFIRAWTGSLGRFVVQMTDKGLIEFGIIEDPIKPTDKLTIVPGIRAFNLRDPSGGSEFITDFYKELNKIDKEVNSIIILEKRGEFKEAIELREKINMKNKNVLQLLSIRDALSGINYTIRNIHNTKKYTADEKRELIDIQYLLMIKTAKRGLDYMNLKVDKENER